MFYDDNVADYNSNMNPLENAQRHQRSDMGRQYADFENQQQKYMLHNEYVCKSGLLSI